MKTPINSILEEFVNDMGLALGMEWRYQYQPYYDDPANGLEIELSVYGLIIGSGEDTITYGIASATEVMNWKVLEAGILFFYRLIGQHVLPECVTRQPCGLTKFAVGLARAAIDGIRDNRVVVMSFKDGRNDVRWR